MRVIKCFGLRSLLCAMLVLPFATWSCTKPETEKPVSNVSISPVTLSLEIGATGKLEATVSPSDATDNTVSWNSSNPGVATVSSDGTVTGVAEGTASVTASAGGKRASCQVTVSKKVIAVTSVTLDKTEGELLEGETLQLTVTVKPDDATDKSVVWSTDKKDVAKVSDSGLVTAVSEGEATVTASAGGESATCVVTVREPEYKAKERAALVAFYKANNGDSWERNDNWCTDSPLKEWYGVKMSQDGRHVTGIGLSYNEVDGYIPREIADLTELESLSIRNYYHLASASSPLPAEIGSLSKLKHLDLQNYSLSGKLPETLYDLVGLEFLRIVYAEDMQPAPLSPSLGKLVNLTTLNLSKMNLTGKIIPEIGSLTNLTTLTMFGNELTGSIPESFGGLVNLETLDLSSNYLSGEIPASFYRVKNYWKLWTNLVWQNDFTQEQIRNAKIPAPKSPVIYDLDGEPIDLEEEFSRNQYTALLRMTPFTESMQILPDLADLYRAKKDEGFGVIAYYDNNIQDPALKKKRTDEFVKAMKDSGAGWKSFVRYVYEHTDTTPFFGEYGRGLYPYASTDDMIVIGPDNTICYTTLIDDESENRDRMLNAMDYLRGVFDSPVHRYESTDYSADGKVSVLQKATVGNGIDIVITGDIYSDRMIADGTFRSAATQAMEDLFSEEPFKSMRSRFNVYQVDAVSKNEDMFNGMSSAFSVKFVGATAMTGDDSKVLDYALKAVGSSRMDNVLVLVLVNSSMSGGIAFNYSPVDPDDYAGGPAVTYVPYKGITKSDGVSDKVGTILHEAGGHGFGKLADEYSIRSNGRITDAVIYSLKHGFQAMGWFLNVDTTNDLSKILWSKFIGDKRFESEKIGAYRGGYTYANDIWRPTEQSVMNDNFMHSEFNAPSRALIYSRIMKLSEGRSWEFDYETFAEWDVAHRPSKASRRPMVLKDAAGDRTHFAPVIVPKTWRQVVEGR